jgi:ribulose-5-phosphate 4-epimerase/fuculose-1-phosphate aldolase
MEDAMAPPAAAQRNDPVSAAEWEVRVQLAACYRIFDHIGWTESIYNHITAKVPGPEEHFLINPFGLHYSEVTASNLVKIDLEGNAIGASEWPINPAGYVIHSAIHAARADAGCIMHTHTTTGMAVACLEEGLMQMNFYSAFFHDMIAYHDFEGLTTRLDERERLVASLGQKDLLILRNHGLLAIGRSIPDALSKLWRLQRACDVQVTALSLGRPVIPLSAEVAKVSTELNKTADPEGRAAEREFDALQRMVDRKDPSYRN